MSYYAILCRLKADSIFRKPRPSFEIPGTIQSCLTQHPVFIRDARLALTILSD